MTYVSPFGDMDSDHEWPDALCLSRQHCVNASDETIGEFYAGAVTLIDAGIPQPAFFLTRQLAELSLKALAEPGQNRLTRRQFRVTGAHRCNHWSRRA